MKTLSPDAKAAALECTHASDEERMSFPQVVMTLMQAGIERYHTDLCAATKTYYLPDGASETIACDPVENAPAEPFNANGVAAAIKTIQAGAMTYAEFCAEIANAGCVGYLVSLAGRRAVYYGRTGDMHIEWFPGARS
ncbi:MAG: DUF1398 family protein [Pseudolabrys sp.]|nr:DUF1398 family protein [Pseudolabrys sp.]